MVDRHDDERPRALSRRDVLYYLGVTVAGGSLARGLTGCSDDSAGGTGDGATDGSADGAGDGASDGSAADGSEAGDGSETGDGSASADDAGSATGWAAGGTVAMTGLADYPNPFDGVVDTSCTPTCAMTLGPCHDDQAPEREDISEGQTGLPMRFGLRIVDASCNPVTDADVDIWHCDVRGVYSSETADNPPFCTGDDAVALAARWFRGHQKTDAQGVAWFSTCFPGWYSGRAIHIHLTVRRSSRDGDEYLTSQVAFPPSLIAELCSSHPDYEAHGQPDTSNTSDSVFPSDSVDDYVVETQRMDDGALLAWKTIIIRSSLSDSVCSASGSGGGGMMPPP